MEPCSATVDVTHRARISLADDGAVVLAIRVGRADRDESRGQRVGRDPTGGAPLETKTVQLDQAYAQAPSEVKRERTS